MHMQEVFATKWVKGKYRERYATPTVKHPPSQMIWGAMPVSGTAALYFLPLKTTMTNS